jgi:hypothetical protein
MISDFIVTVSSLVIEIIYQTSFMSSSFVPSKAINTEGNLLIVLLKIYA